MRTRSSLLFIPLLALGACITNSEVGVYPRDDKGEAPGLTPDPGRDGGAEAGPLADPID